MKKFIIILSIIAVMIGSMFFGYEADGESDRDLCGVCSGNQEIQSGQKQTAELSKTNSRSAYINLSAMVFVGLIWIGALVFLWLKKKKSLVYLLFFTIFYIYLVKILDITLFQFQALIILKHFVPNLILRGQRVGESINFIPLATLTLNDIKTTLLNILMMMPFGFGLPFVTKLRMKRVVVIGMFFSIVIEFLQFITGFMAAMTFRIADINDVIFNTVGVVIGYIFFVGFVRIYRHIFRNWKISANPILRYIAERPQI